MSTPSRVPAPARTPVELRKFGLQLAGIFVVFGAISRWVSQHPERAMVFWGASAVLVALGLVVPVALRPLERFLVKLGERIGRFTTPLVLGAFYYLVVTPFGWMRRLIVGDPLNRRLGNRGASAWIKRGDRPDAASYRQQF